MQRSIQDVVSLCCASGAEAGLKNRRMSAASIALEVSEVEGQLVSAQTIRHTLPQVLHVCMAVIREGSLFWSWLTKKPANSLLKTTWPRAWILWSDESKVNLFDSDGVQHVWRRPGEENQYNCALPTVKHGGGSIMVWGCMTTAGTGELRFIGGNMDSNMHCDIPKQKMMPSLPKLFSNITTTPNTPPRWQLPCCWRWRWWSGQVCLQTWTLLSKCRASSSGRKRSTMCGRGCQQQPVQLWWIPCPGGLIPY